MTLLQHCVCGVALTLHGAVTWVLAVRRVGGGAQFIMASVSRSRFTQVKKGCVPGR